VILNGTPLQSGYTVSFTLVDAQAKLKIQTELNTTQEKQTT